MAFIEVMVILDCIESIMCVLEIVQKPPGVVLNSYDSLIFIFSNLFSYN